MAKLLKLRRGTTTQHGSFTGAEGEVTIDTTKDTAVVHDGSQAGGRPLAREDMSNVSSASIAGQLGTDSIATTKIAAGALPTDVTITNANIVSNASIAGTKLENSGVSAGSYGSSSAIPTITVDAQGLVTSASTSSIDSTSIANGTSNVAVVNNGNITTTRSGTARLVVNDAGAAVTGNLDVSSGVDVTGDITVTGTVDGVDVAALNTTVGALGIASGVINGATTAATQSAGDNSTKVATTAYTDTAVSNLVDSSPSALNTLNELAAAVGDDANFSTTITNSISTKMPLAGGEFTGDVTCDNITPDADSSRSLGTNSVRFANIYGDTLYGDGSNLTGIQGIPSGIILLWSGAANAIPSGFVICDGNNSTPDLRDKFLVGAGSTYSVNDTGGAATATDTVSITGTDTVSISVSGNAAGDIHSIYSVQGTGFSHAWKLMNVSGSNFSKGRLTIPFSGSGSDTVSITGTDTVSIDNRPPYYALCYVMKT